MCSSILRQLEPLRPQTLLANWATIMALRVSPSVEAVLWSSPNRASSIRLRPHVNSFQLACFSYTRSYQSVCTVESGWPNLHRTKDPTTSRKSLVYAAMLVADCARH